MIGYSVGNGTQHIYKDSLGRIYVNAYIDGTLTNASGSVTVTVTDEAGTVIINGQTATTDATGIYYYDLGITNTTNVNKLYAVWSGTWESVVQKLRTNHEILGFPLFTEAQARTFDIAQLNSATDYSDATILEERAKITDLLEQWTGASWTPKYSLEKMQGDTTRVLSVPHFNVNKVISVTILGETVLQVLTLRLITKQGLFIEQMASFQKRLQNIQCQLLYLMSMDGTLLRMVLIVLH